MTAATPVAVVLLRIVLNERRYAVNLTDRKVVIGVRSKKLLMTFYGQIVHPWRSYIPFSAMLDLCIREEISTGGEEFLRNAGPEQSSGFRLALEPKDKASRTNGRG